MKQVTTNPTGVDDIDGWWESLSDNDKQEIFSKYISRKSFTTITEREKNYLFYRHNFYYEKIYIQSNNW